MSEIARDAPVALPDGRIHLIGIGGAGMSAIATVLVAMGHVVSGSDEKDSPALARLRALGIEVHVGHAAGQVDSAALVARSSAIGEANPEVQAARSRGVPVASRASLLAAICRTRRTIAVSGTHGKSTTTAMLALALREAGADPGWIVGAEVPALGASAHWSDGELFVVEADESDATFLALGAEIAIVTSVDRDHLEHYGGFDNLQEAFREFMAEAKAVVVSGDDRRASSLAPSEAVRYGTAPVCDVVMSGIETGLEETTFHLERGGVDLGTFSIRVAGVHHAHNAAAAIAVALSCGAELNDVRRALGSFDGVARRFEIVGEAHGVTYIDDYAHLPAEVAANVAAARAAGFERVVAVFQPHRYSRTAEVAPEFADSFVDADVVVITAIDPAGEAPRPGVSAKQVLDAVLDAHPGTTAAYLPDRDDLVEYLHRRLRPGDCCLCLGAGTISTLAATLFARAIP